LEETSVLESLRQIFAHDTLVIIYLYGFLLTDKEKLAKLIFEAVQLSVEGRGEN